MAALRKVLCVHGIGHAELDEGFRESWRLAIESSVANIDPGAKVAVEFLEYDELFEHAPLNPITYGLAFTRLLASILVHSVLEGVTTRRGLGDLPAMVRWTAGMVAQWSTEERLRSTVRARLEKRLADSGADLVLAHSLGSLIAYDTFGRNPGLLDGKVLVTLGSQVGHPAVRDLFAGRIGPIVPARHWYHLYNPHDHVFTSPLRISAPNFEQIDTQFDVPNDVLNHEATWYLRHASTIEGLWRPLLETAPRARVLTMAPRPVRERRRGPNRKALIVGINNYPDPANRLEGCVNDSFLMSALLQECGYDADDIRLVLDERATTEGILERIDWLLNDVREGDERVLYYSGHGAQIPAYGPNEEPDHFSESLVPHDFDWTPKHSITDRQFSELYSQLPYGATFLAIFDCCHSGGLTRDGGPRVRGINPPDDVRHRALRWSKEEQMWVARDFPMINRSLKQVKNWRDLIGADGATHKLGRAARLRRLPRAEYLRTRKALGHKGPYLPLLLEACQESEYSYEYRHGSTSYGAFTYCLAQAIREGKTLSFKQVAEQVTTKLHRLGYEQTPLALGAKAQLEKPVPWDRPVLPRRRKEA